MKFFNRTTLLILLFLSTGLLSGCALPELLRMGTGSYAGFSSLYSFREYSTASVNSLDIFPCVASVRLRTLLFLWMSSFTTAGILFHLLYAWWLTASAAMLLSLFALRDGAHGILIFVCCLFPQWFLYGLMWRQEIGVWLQRLHGISGTSDTFVRVIRKNDLAELGRLLLLCVSGCACEAFLGKWTLQVFLQL